MTATDELRRLLDERGEKHYDCPECTLWLKDGVSYRAYAEEGTNGLIYLRLWCTTPAQAVEATLGRGTCHNMSMRLDESRFSCSECEFSCWVKDVADGKDKQPCYCPNCGREVVTE